MPGPGTGPRPSGWETLLQGNVQFHGHLPPVNAVYFRPSLSWQQQLLFGGNERSYRNPAFQYEYQLGLNFLTTGRIAILAAMYLPTKFLSSEDCGTAEDLHRLQHRYWNIISRKAKNFRAMSKTSSTRRLCTPVVTNFKESHTVHIQQIIYITARNNLF
jgi:hypothetical protein